MKCSACGGENSVGARFCKHCGAQQSAPVADQPDLGSTVCPSCGKPNKPGAKFCTSCSASLTAAEPTHAELVVPQALIQSKDMAPRVDDLSSASVTVVAEVNADTTEPMVADEAEAFSNHAYEQKPNATKPLMWVLGAIVVGALAAGAYLYLGERSTPTPIEANAPATAPAASPDPAQTPVPAAAPVAPAHPSSLPVPPEPVNGNAPAAPKPTAATPEGVKKAQPVTKHATPEKSPMPPVASKQPSTPKPNPQSTPSDTSKSQTEPSAVKSDKPGYESELDACRKKGFFERGVCSEQVKWKFCTVNGVWDNTKPGCERPSNF